jgi:hypothetical protein
MSQLFGHYYSAVELYVTVVWSLLHSSRIMSQLFCHYYSAVELYVTVVWSLLQW